MNRDEKYFEQKFKECSQFINAKPKDIISYKYRANRDYLYYKELLANLNDLEGLMIEPLGHVMNGLSYKISYEGQSIILVEHETGLEILSILGSVASLISLVLQVASMIKDHRKSINSYSSDLGQLEVRYFDKKGHFVEEHRPNIIQIETFLFSQIFFREIEMLKMRITDLENIIKQLTDKKKNKK